MRDTVLRFAFILVAASSALAQPAETNCPHPSGQRAAPSPALIAARQAEHQACAADMTRFCAGVPHGCGRPMQCLKAHRTELSATCTTAITQLRAARVQPH